MCEGKCQKRKRQDRPVFEIDGGAVVESEGGVAEDGLPVADAVLEKRVSEGDELGGRDGRGCSRRRASGSLPATISCAVFSLAGRVGGPS